MSCVLLTWNDVLPVSLTLYLNSVTTRDIPRLNNCDINASELWTYRYWNEIWVHLLRKKTFSSTLIGWVDKIPQIPQIRNPLTIYNPTTHSVKDFLHPFWIKASNLISSPGTNPVLLILNVTETWPLFQKWWPIWVEDSVSPGN